MKQRWLVALIGLPLLLLVLLACPPWATMLLICAVAGAAAYELLHVAGKNAANTVYATTIAFAVCEVLCIYFVGMQTVPAHYLLFSPLMLTVFLFLLAVTTFGKESGVPFSDVSAALVGGAVFPMMFACVALLRGYGDFGRVYVLAPFFVAFAGDSLAMYFGKWFGKKKMSPHVSPNKTWAGFWGNLLGSALGMLLLGWIGNRWLGYLPNYPLLVAVGAVSNLFGQLGDLSTSLIKREHDVKDYSHLFLTHGGVLDRFDSTLFIAPVIYVFVSFGII
ncbi:MAG: phosphatidate cytidylyltransferase [Oscillospiraceae bacterium]|nr:phosphatidate cytidylyltransferase [Oscillospiraceae bacterium]